MKTAELIDMAPSPPTPSFPEGRGESKTGLSCPRSVGGEAGAVRRVRGFIGHLIVQKSVIVMTALALLLPGTHSGLNAQDWNSHLEGLVLDPTGAAIPAASVRLHNVATGLDRETRTDARGFYSFPLLPVGTYDLNVAKAGFALKTLKGLVLQVSQTARVNVRLELEHERTSLQVDAQAPLIQTASPSLGDEIDNRRASLLPLNGRQFSQLALLTAGAGPTYPNSSSQQFNTPAMGLGFSVDG